jgi:phosphinothricin acetyltransferase
MLTIRSATLQDLGAITEIYNDAILKTVATFDTETKTEAEQQRWFEGHGSRYPILVAEEDNLIVGWASLSQWSDRCAYSDTAEASLYVREEYRGRGIGRKLNETIIKAGGEAGLHTLIGRITEGNETSIHLTESAGFKQIGVMRECGRKFGRLLDVHLVQYIYED